MVFFSHQLHDSAVSNKPQTNSLHVEAVNCTLSVSYDDECPQQFIRWSRSTQHSLLLAGLEFGLTLLRWRRTLL